MHVISLFSVSELAVAVEHCIGVKVKHNFYSMLISASCV